LTPLPVAADGVRWLAVGIALGLIAVLLAGYEAMEWVLA
jgi:hypothetical protein